MEEVNCKDGTSIPEEYLQNAINQANNLEKLRNALQSPIHINSWYRSPKYNIRIGGEKDSQHLLGKATDIWVYGIKPETLFKVIETLIRTGYLEQGGLGLYDTFVHYDNRGTIARWNLKKE